MLTHTVDQQCQDMWRLTEQLEVEVTQVVRRVEDAVARQRLWWRVQPRRTRY
jgi:hypothetical protein